jgi:hypothetical protein
MPQKVHSSSNHFQLKFHESTELLGKTQKQVLGVTISSPSEDRDVIMSTAKNLKDRLTNLNSDLHVSDVILNRNEATFKVYSDKLHASIVHDKGFDDRYNFDSISGDALYQARQEIEKMLGMQSPSLTTLISSKPTTSASVSHSR